MELRKIDVALGVAVTLLLSTYIAAFVIALNPRQETVYAKVFDCLYREGSDITVVYTYGHGILKFYGRHELEIDETYIFVFKGGGRYEAVCRLIEVIKQ